MQFSLPLTSSATVLLQMETSFQAQGLHMRFSIHTGNGTNLTHDDTSMLNEVGGTKFSVSSLYYAGVRSTEQCVFESNCHICI